MNQAHFYPIGTPGQKWGDTEVALWRAAQSRHRRYDVDILPRIDALADQFAVIAYGELDYAGDRYTLFALRSPKSTG